MKNLYILFLLLILMYAPAQNQQPATERYIKVPHGYLMVLRQGDIILQEIEKMAVDENVPAATFTGLGFVNITFGFFDFKTRHITPRRLRIWNLPH
ncbi:hypothetical protein ACLI09_06035 [Flavobacterium sp. RHBU_24]|uniref:hypothetical protein n=1 Tax=Flavobacterium sp. RHBU_24 TaxID=3391185 RepID=UPI0039847D34